MFENRVLERVFGTRMDEVMGGGDCIMRSSMVCTHPHILYLLTYLLHGAGYYLKS